MNWQELTQYLEQNYDFFNRMSVSSPSDHQGIAIHPVLRLSASLALKAMSSSENNRLAILFPSRLNWARWLAILCTLEIMKEDYERNSGVTKFSSGQKLLVSKCIVEYLGEEFIPKFKRHVMWVKCSDGKYGIPLDRKLIFQPVNTNRPLSSLRKIGEACQSAQLANNQIDYVLGIRTLGNKSLFKENVILVSRIGETDHFIKENFINSTSIMNLFLWGKIDVEGNVSIIVPHQIQGNPCCVVSSDLFGVWNYVQDSAKKSKGIILDGSASYINNLQILDEFLDKKMPVVAVCDLLDAEHLQHLIGRGFKIWQWNRENLVHSGAITEINKFSPFSHLNDSLQNYYNQKTNSLLCHHPQLNEVVEESIELGKLISDNEQLNIPYVRLIRLINDLSRLVRIPEQSWFEGLQQKLGLLRQQFNSHQQWLSDKAIQCIGTIFAGLADMAECPFTNDTHKVNILYDFINSTSSSDMIGILVARTEETERSQQYWGTRFPWEKLRNIRFVTLPYLLSSERSFAPDKIIACGWLGVEKMFSILYSHITPSITTLVYPFENKWFRSAQQVWSRQNNFDIRAVDFSDMLGLTEKDLEIIEYKPERPVETAEDEHGIFDFELKIRKIYYRSYVYEKDAREFCKAKLVVFAGNRFAFLTESHRLPVVTEVMKEKSSEDKFPRRDITQLQIGDYVLFQESNRDIIREIADKGLAKAGQSHLRQSAGLWRRALHEAYLERGKDMDRITGILRIAGCKRTRSTIKNWLDDEDQIGTEKMSDILCIAKATGNRSLNDRLEEVEDAINRVRRAHDEASSYIRKKLLACLPDIVGDGYARDTHASGLILLNLDEFGQVAIMRIEDIGDDWEKVPTNKANHLRMEEG